jgi:hypothetical protein
MTAATASAPPITAEMIEENRLPQALDPDAPPARAVIAFLRDYFEVWNAKDAAGLNGRIYRLDPGPRLQNQDDFQRLLDETRAGGWDRSTMDWITVHPYGESGFLARIGYSRFTADGSLMPPANRLSAYVVKPFADGLRITALPLAHRPR